MKMFSILTLLILGFIFLWAAMPSSQKKINQNGFLPYTQEIPGSKITIDLVSVPGSKFIMGSPEKETARKTDEGPEHTVEVDSFWIGKYEITWDQYELFMFREIDKVKGNKANEVNIQVDAVSGATKPYVEMSFGMGRKNFPVINITQFAAITFCKWLSAKTGHFYRLPTEAEWEYACRAGSQSAYSFGNDLALLDEYAWYEGNSSGAYHQIGQKKPNPWGLYDIHGNVAEWTMDQYLPNFYTTKKSQNSPWAFPTTLYPHAVRGGSWMDKAENLRSAARRASEPKWKQRDPQLPKSQWWLTDAPFVGFRILRPKKTPSPAEMEKYWLTPIDDL